MVGVRIDGHTDIVPPNPEKKNIRRWRTNRELSQFRANELIPIIQDIFKESYPDSIYKKLTGKIYTTGYGPSKPLANSIKENNNWFVVIDKTIDDPMNKDGLIKLKQPSREIADSVANMRNRRVVINILKRGY